MTMVILCHKRRQTVVITKRGKPLAKLVPADAEPPASVSLPGEFRRDPSDRILVATARALAARFVTADRGWAAVPLGRGRI